MYSHKVRSDVTESNRKNLDSCLIVWFQFSNVPNFHYPTFITGFDQPPEVAVITRSIYKTPLTHDNSKLLYLESIMTTVLKSCAWGTAPNVSYFSLYLENNRFSFYCLTLKGGHPLNPTFTYALHLIKLYEPQLPNSSYRIRNITQLWVATNVDIITTDTPGTCWDTFRTSGLTWAKTTEIVFVSGFFQFYWLHLKRKTEAESDIWVILRKYSYLNG